MPTTGAHGIIIPDPSTANAIVNQVRDLAIQTEAGLADVEATVAAAIDLDSYATKTYVGTTLSSYATKSYVDSAVADGGASGSLIPLTGNVTIPAGTEQGDLVGYRNFGSTTYTVNGAPLPPGQNAIFTWTGYMWVRADVPAGPPDTEPPTAPTSVSATPGANTATLTWTAATDNVAVGGYEARVRQTALATWTAWAPLARGGQITGLQPSTGYTAEVRAYDVSGNRGPAGTTTFTTTAVPLTGDITDTFTGADEAPMPGRTTTTGGKTWEDDTDNLLGANSAADPTKAIIYNNRYSSAALNRIRIPIDRVPVEVSFDYRITNSTFRFGVGNSTNLVSTFFSTGTSSFTLYRTGGNLGTYNQVMPVSGRFTLIRTATHVELKLDGETIIGPAAYALPTTGDMYLAFSLTGDSRAVPQFDNGPWVDNLSVDYL